MQVQLIQFLLHCVPGETPAALTPVAVASATGAINLPLGKWSRHDYI